MPYRGRKQYKKTTPASPRRVSPKKYAARKYKNTMAASVKRLLSKEIEVKCAPNFVLADQQQIVGAGLNPGSSLGFVTTNIFPQISQGTGDGQRIGNIVRIKKLMFNYTIRAAAVMSTNNFTALPFLVRVIVYKQRYAIDDSSPLLILDSGASSQNLGSTPDDYIKPYNKKLFQIFYSRTFLMQPIRNELTTPISSENVAQGTKTFITRRVQLKIPYKSLIFNDTNNTIQNAGLFAAFCCCNTDGTVINVGSSRAMVNAESQIYYTDA